MKKSIAYFYNTHKIHVLSRLSNQRSYRTAIQELLIDMRTALKSTGPTRQNFTYLYTR